MNEIMAEFKTPFGVGPMSNSFIRRAKRSLGLMSSCYLPPLLRGHLAWVQWARTHWAKILFVRIIKILKFASGGSPPLSLKEILKPALFVRQIFLFHQNPPSHFLRDQKYSSLVRLRVSKCMNPVSPGTMPVAIGYAYGWRYLKNNSTTRNTFQSCQWDSAIPEKANQVICLPVPNVQKNGWRPFLINCLKGRSHF